MTPVVVSSVTPRTLSPIRVHLPGSSRQRAGQQLEDDPVLVRLGGLRVGHLAGRARTRRPCGRAASRRRRRRGSCSARRRARSSACSVHHQYSSSVSPFQAKTGTPLGSSTVPSGPTTTAAAAGSWVEKMLQLAQRTSAPSAVSVSIRTAVCTVMWSEPVIRAPASGWEAANSSRVAHQAGHLVLGELDLLAAELGQRRGRRPCGRRARRTVSVVLICISYRMVGAGGPRLKRQILRSTRRT